MGGIKLDNSLKMHQKWLRIKFIVQGYSEQHIVNTAFKMDFFIRTVSKFLNIQMIQLQNDIDYYRLFNKYTHFC